jgi:hypothetical protein
MRDEITQLVRVTQDCPHLRRHEPRIELRQRRLERREPYDNGYPIVADLFGAQR